MIGPHRVWAHGPCFYCNSPTFRCSRMVAWTYTRDHVLPKRFRVGVKQPLTVTACLSCNRRKANRRPEVFLSEYFSEGYTQHILQKLKALGYIPRKECENLEANNHV